MSGELVETAVAAAEAAVEAIAPYFRRDRLEVVAKGRKDFVTAADHASERAIVETILARYPGDRILSEEGTVNPAVTSEREWVIDPIDGTTNFLQGLPVWAVSIACRRGGELLAGVVRDPEGRNLFTAERGAGAFRNGERLRVSARAGVDDAFLATGFPFRAEAALDLYLDIFRELFRHARAIRRCGAAALDLAYLAAGVYDGFFEFRLSPWDIGAGTLLVREAGGRVTDLDGGGRSFETGDVVAGGAAVQPALLAAVRRHASEALLDRLSPPRPVVPA